MACLLQYVYINNSSLAHIPAFPIEIFLIKFNDDELFLTSEASCMHSNRVESRTTLLPRMHAWCDRIRIL